MKTIELYFLYKVKKILKFKFEYIISMMILIETIFQLIRAEDIFKIPSSIIFVLFSIVLFYGSKEIRRDFIELLNKDIQELKKDIKKEVISKPERLSSTKTTNFQNIFQNDFILLK